MSLGVVALETLATSFRLLGHVPSSGFDTVGSRSVLTGVPSIQGGVLPWPQRICWQEGHSLKYRVSPSGS
jgi:hypothetical protein